MKIANHVFAATMFILVGCLAGIGFRHPGFSFSVLDIAAAKVPLEAAALTAIDPACRQGLMPAFHRVP